MSLLPTESRKLLDALRAYFRREDWPVEFEEADEWASAVAVEADNGRWLCVLQVLEARPVAVFSSILPTFIEPEHRFAMGEFLHRANAGLLVGGFQFDWDEGEVRYVTSLDFTGVDVDPLIESGQLDSMFRQIVYTNVATVDQYLPALLTVIYADAEPSLAVQQAELD